MGYSAILFFVLLGLLHEGLGRFGPFDTAAPDERYRKHVKHPKAVNPLWGDVKIPYPTNAWWLNAVMNSGDQTLNTFPYISKAKRDTLCFTNPTFAESKDWVLSNYIDEWCIKLPETTGHKVVHWDEVSVTMRYQMASSTVEFPFVMGTPFLVAVYNKAKPDVMTITAILEVKDENGKVYKPEGNPTTDPSSKFTILLNNNRRWVVYFDTKVPLTLSVSSIKGPDNYVGAMKWAGIDNDDMATQLDKYRHSYATGVRIDFSVTGLTAHIMYRWQLKGTGTLLMLAMPHHMDVLVKPVVVDGVGYRSIRGRMVGVAGNNWTCNEFLPRYTWDSPTPVDPAKIPEIKKALEDDYKFVPGAKDPYFFGVEVGRLARMTLIADQINDGEKATYMRATLEKVLIPWLEATNPNPLLYDNTYGGIVSTDGIAAEQNDFGNGYYNDHHFHYGYHVYGCAVIGRKNPAFLQKYKSVILTYVRDYANPSPLDPYFTVTRNKDWYGWHSWAAGLFEFADGRNQESTSEALMSYYAVMLMGEALGHKNMTDFGKLLLAMELRSTKMYWHMPSTSKIYPELFKSNKMVGIVWANKVDYATWFGKNPLFIHGIQMLPFLPPTEYSLDKAFIKEEYEIIKGETSPGDWVPYRVCTHAIIDKAAAWAEALQCNAFHVGTSKTIMLHWVATRPSTADE